VAAAAAATAEATAAAIAADTMMAATAAAILIAATAVAIAATRLTIQVVMNLIIKAIILIIAILKEAIQDKADTAAQTGLIKVIIANKAIKAAICTSQLIIQYIQEDMINKAIKAAICNSQLIIQYIQEDIAKQVANKAIKVAICNSQLITQYIQGDMVNQDIKEDICSKQDIKMEEMHKEPIILTIRVAIQLMPTQELAEHQALTLRQAAIANLLCLTNTIQGPLEYSREPLFY
jgi:hypothetical protein